MNIDTRNEKIVNKISNIINNKMFIGAYIGLKNSYKKAEVNVYTNKNGNNYHFIMRIFVDDNTEYKQGVLSNQYYLCNLASSLGKDYESLTNTEALMKYWVNAGLKIDNILSVGV